MATDDQPMTSLAESDVRTALAHVVDPTLGKDLISLGVVESVSVSGDDVSVLIATPKPDEELHARMRATIEEAITETAKIQGKNHPTVTVDFAARVRLTEQKSSPPQEDTGLPNVRHVIAVGAGKGGVGKSTASVCLAIGLARMGAKVGLLDGDIYGPSIPTMLGLDDAPQQVRDTTLIPFEAHGIKAVSIGKLVDADKPLIWRGPMAHGAFKQLALQTDWGALDFLLVDLPPGTGDVPLTLSQLLPLTGAVIVLTPQRVAQEDARRAARMFQKLDVEVLGVIENMSSFTGDDGKEYDLFGRGGAEILAQTMGLPFLGNLPIHPELRANLDDGNPSANWEQDEALAKALDGLASGLANRVALTELSGDGTRPTLEIN